MGNSLLAAVVATNIPAVEAAIRRINHLERFLDLFDFRHPVTGQQVIGSGVFNFDEWLVALAHGYYSLIVVLAQV